MENSHIHINIKGRLNSYPDILSVKQLCEILDIGKNTAYRLLQCGEIKSIKIGKVYKIPKKEVRRYLSR